MFAVSKDDDDLDFEVGNGPSVYIIFVCIVLCVWCVCLCMLCTLHGSIIYRALLCTSGFACL